MLRALSLGISEKDLVIDVGANIGNHALYLASVVGCYVHAFEPNRRLHEPLSRSVIKNGFSDRMTIFGFGVGAKKSKAVLDGINEDNLGAQSLKIIEDESSGIDIFPLDDFAFDKTVAVIKVDVEGMELDVLKGAEQLIEKDKPLLVVEASTSSSYSLVEEFMKNKKYLYCHSFNGTPTHFFIHQDKILGTPWVDLFYDNGRNFYQMRHYHKKLKKAVQELRRLGVKGW